MVKVNEVEVRPFLLDDFTQHKVQHSMMNKVTKKEHKNPADDLGLAYDEAQILFTKKLLSAYLTGK